MSKGTSEANGDSNKMMTRRHFLKTAGALSLGFVGLNKFLACMETQPIPQNGLVEGFGPLIPDPGQIIDLPAGFSYQVISRAGEVMTDGFIVPTKHDGMAAFPGPDGLTILVRNHEVSSGESGRHGAFGRNNELLGRLDPKYLYDIGQRGRPCLGGTTTLVFDTQKQHLERSFLSLAGTVRNCAGGPTPWNSWLTCEETVERAGKTLAKDHGYCFEVPVTANPKLAKAEPLTEMGRFYREAVAVDPVSGIVYQTEDLTDGLIYRFIPNELGRLVNGGRLQALCVQDHARMDMRNWGGRLVQPRVKYSVEWLDLYDVDSPDDDLRYRGFEKGAARFARAEGMWYGNDAVYFSCTNGGVKKKGQVWRYIPSPNEGTGAENSEPGRLELFIEPNNGALVENCDNVTVTPWGDLILCEDGSGEQYLVGVTPDGQIYKFAHNAVSNSEFAGATFSPDGSTLFVNIQHAGMTLAIVGPWRTRHLS